VPWTDRRDDGAVDRLHRHHRHWADPQSHPDADFRPNPNADREFGDYNFQMSIGDTVYGTFAGLGDKVSTAAVVIAWAALPRAGSRIPQGAKSQLDLHPVCCKPPCPRPDLWAYSHSNPRLLFDLGKPLFGRGERA